MRWILIVVTGVLMGCTSTEDDSYKKYSQVVCTREVRTGTLIPKSVCRTRAQMEAEAAEAEKTMDEIRDSSPPVRAPTRN